MYCCACCQHFRNTEKEGSDGTGGLMDMPFHIIEMPPSCSHINYKMVLLPIDMPKNCVIDCPCWDENALSECQILHKGEEDYEGVDPITERLPDCPLIEMHTQKVMSMSEQGTKDTIEKFCKLFIRGDWSNWE